MSLLNGVCCCSGVCCFCNDPEPDTCENPSTPANCAVGGGYFLANCDICLGSGNCCVYSTNYGDNHCCPNGFNGVVLEDCIDGLTFCECMAEAVGGRTSVFHLGGVCVNNGCNEPNNGCTSRRYEVFYQSTHEDYEAQCALSSGVCVSYHGEGSPNNIYVAEVTTTADVNAKNSALAAWAATSFTVTSGNATLTKTRTSQSIGTFETSECGRYVDACDFPFTIEASEAYSNFEPGTCTENWTAINTFPVQSTFNAFYSTLKPPPDNILLGCPPWVKYSNYQCTFTPATCTSTGGVYTHSGSECP